MRARPPPTEAEKSAVPPSLVKSDPTIVRLLAAKDEIAPPKETEAPAVAVTWRSLYRLIGTLRTFAPNCTLTSARAAPCPIRKDSDAAAVSVAPTLPLKISAWSSGERPLRRTASDEAPAKVAVSPTLRTPSRPGIPPRRCQRAQCASTEPSVQSLLPASQVLLPVYAKPVMFTIALRSMGASDRF